MLFRSTAEDSHSINQRMNEKSDTNDQDSSHHDCQERDLDFSSSSRVRRNVQNYSPHVTRKSSNPSPSDIGDGLSHLILISHP